MIKYEKSSYTVWLQCFRTGDKGGKNGKGRVPQECKRRYEHIAPIPCEYREQRATAELADFLWACNPLSYIRRPILFPEWNSRQDYPPPSAWYPAWRFERGRFAYRNGNGKGGYWYGEAKMRSGQFNKGWNAADEWCLLRFFFLLWQFSFFGGVGSKGDKVS